MDPVSFLNGMFMFSALQHWAEHVDKNHSLSWKDHKRDLPEAGRQAYTMAMLDEQNPGVSWNPEHGWFITHDFEPEIRMVCWAEMGEEALAKHAARWRQTVNPAMPDPPPEDAPKPEPPQETELAPWSREATAKMAAAIAEGLGDVDQGVRDEFGALMDGLDEMSDWDLWQWLDKVNLWHHCGRVSNRVKAACWPRPFYQAPERPTPVPDAKTWAYTWSARPYTTAVKSDTPMDEDVALEKIREELGRLPVGLALWPYADDRNGLAL